MPDATASKRQRDRRQRVEDAGGRRLSLLLSPRAARNLAMLERLQGGERGSTTKAIELALEAAIQVARARRAAILGGQR